MRMGLQRGATCTARQHRQSTSAHFVANQGAMPTRYNLSAQHRAGLSAENLRHRSPSWFGRKLSHQMAWLTRSS